MRKYNLDDGLAVPASAVDVHGCAGVCREVLAVIVSPVVCVGLDNEPVGMCWLHQFCSGCVLS